MPHCTPAELDQVKLLSGLSPEQRAPLAPQFGRRRLHAGEMLLQFGQPSDEVHVLLQGELQVIMESPDGRAVIYRDFAIGDVIGDFGAIDRQPRSANVYAVGEAVVAVLGSAQFRQLLASHPVVAAAEMQHLVSVLRSLTRRIYELSTQAAQDRLKAELLRLGEPSADNPQAREIAPIPTQSELAARIGSHREAVSRHLGQLEREGLILRERGRLLIPDPRRLTTGDEVAEPDFGPLGATLGAHLGR